MENVPSGKSKQNPKIAEWAPGSSESFLEVAGTGSFEQLKSRGVLNGFSYSDRNFSFASAEDEVGRLQIERDTSTFLKTLSMSEGSMRIRIRAQTEEVGKIVFVGDSPPPSMEPLFKVRPESLVSLNEFYPNDTTIQYPKLIDGGIDAVFISSPDIILDMPTRDCIAAMISINCADTVIAGLLHAGWRQVDGGIGQRITQALTQTGEVQVQDIRIAIGPALRKEHLVLPHTEGINNASSWGSYLTEEVDGFHLDFVGLFRRQLEEAGIPRENILDSGIDTYSSQSEGVGHSAYFQREHALPPRRMLSAVTVENR